MDAVGPTHPVQLDRTQDGPYPVLAMRQRRELVEQANDDLNQLVLGGPEDALVGPHERFR